MSIKAYFVSRFPDGKLIEADYSQLEVRILAALSHDKQLIQDLEDGIDMHRTRAAEWLRKSPDAVTPEERRKAKQISFQLQYGAGYKSVAQKNGISVDDAKRFIDVYYRRYPAVKAWQEAVQYAVQTTRKISDRHHHGYPVGKGTYTCPYTGKVYTFFERFSDFRGGTVDFYKPEMNNYPVQGLATGDIVPIVLGKVMRNILTTCPDVQLATTTHDSIMVDSPAKDVRIAGRILKFTMERASYYLEEMGGCKLPIELPVDVKYGDNWEEMIPLDLS